MGVHPSGHCSVSGLYFPARSTDTGRWEHMVGPNDLEKNCLNCVSRDGATRSDGEFIRAGKPGIEEVLNLSDDAKTGLLLGSVKRFLRVS